MYGPLPNDKQILAFLGDKSNDEAITLALGDIKDNFVQYLREVINGMSLPLLSYR